MINNEALHDDHARRLFETCRAIEQAQAQAAEALNHWANIQRAIAEDEATPFDEQRRIVGDLKKIDAYLKRFGILNA